MHLLVFDDLEQKGIAAKSELTSFCCLFEFSQEVRAEVVG